ncbi:chromosome segregation protein SMC [Candidatus Bathyarchaeota archaeon]|nr:chromosome segregation protein SMC [Candidatus Bathyarchaeota archaeon]
MPFIKKIEVNGFKTFGKKTTLVFDKGFTAITGPNGSGKTNIIDAVLFCLGELSSRRLRAENFSKLIFSGSPNSDSRKKNSAKVVIQFDNSDNRLPTDTATVTLSREIDQEGQSIFRINGRRVSRAYAMEILAMAGISPYGHNVVLQGTLTRLAEISPVERRKIIEDMIGIATYDAEKAEADEKLKAADISIKTAMGQVSEVQNRIEALERERNDLLRHNFIQSEIRRFEAAKLSYEITTNQKKISELNAHISVLEKKVQSIRTQRETLQSKRHEIEVEWRKLGFEEAEANQTKLFQIQMEIGDLRSKLVELSTKITSNKASLDNLARTKQNAVQQIESLTKEIESVKNKIGELAPIRDSLKKEMTEKQSAFEVLNEETLKVRAGISEITKKLREIENQIEHIHREVIMLRSQRAESESKVNIYSERLGNLQERKVDYANALNRLEKSLRDLENIRKERTEQLTILRKTLKKKIEKKEVLELEIKEAEKIADVAREALVEFETRKELVNKFTTEENALKYIEKSSDEGIIKGVIGRLKNLINIEKGYERAVEAAAAGWLNALVVDSLETAFICVETLRRLKLGRIKIIPLKGLSGIKMNDFPKIEGKKDKVTSFVKYDQMHEAAVLFVLGDTFLADDEKTALTISQAGYRSVTKAGDLYEAGGGVESGFYRAPIDFSSFVPSESALKDLDKAVTMLKANLNKRELDITELEKEIVNIQNEISTSAETLGKLGSEIEGTRKSIHETERNIMRIEENIASLQSSLEEEKAQIGCFDDAIKRYSLEENKLKDELERLKQNVDFSTAQEREQKREELGTELITLRQRLSQVENQFSSLHLRLESTLKVELKNAYIQRDKASSQITILEQEVDKLNIEKETIQNKIRELEVVKDNLSKSLLTIKSESQRYTMQIDEIDNKLRVLEAEYEQSDKLLDELRLNNQTLNLLVERQLDQLRNLGYEEPFVVPSRGIQDIETSLKIMKLELERIGAVNQLAQAQYEDQITKYKELSIRMNELEKERMAIVEFIEEIERKKYNAFMEAFNKINERIDRYFSKLTDGGSAALKLENPEDPFAGGVDMIVQFVGKPPILVSGASSGERSVSAVAFLFALQEFTPASFYLFDEIDAHLDASNVERLGELLSEEAKKSQFVVITLKPEMVSKADRIYGVYGLEGVSHVVTTTFKGAT